MLESDRAKNTSGKYPKAGFTLIEVLLGALFSFVVISAAGYGLVNLLAANVDSEDKSLSQENLNRAIDFIADEVRTAFSISTTIDSGIATASGFDAGTIDSSVTPKDVLILNLPEVTAGPIIYRIAKPNSSKPWLGPRVIYRWGPDIDVDGNYLDTDDYTKWSNEPLVDAVEDTSTASVSCDADVPNKLPVSSSTGFYACIAPTGKIADIHILGRVASADNPYEISTRTFARSATP